MPTIKPAELPLLRLPVLDSLDSPKAPNSPTSSSLLEELADIFEAGSFDTLPKTPQAPPRTIYASFDIHSAKKFCKDELCLDIMQEIAEKNSQALRGDCYVFSQRGTDLNLDEALSLLVLQSSVEVQSSNSFFIDPDPEVKSLNSLTALKNWWGLEKLKSLL